ncbi:hypothetical protein N7G274_005470 [Stereocaulon virgatum]|uniref:Uncharacterized protein n=1 Tax=Stereocaulon virgatum TaxID=373712 RepID=A0ABR4A9W0_9LECA
MQSICVRRLPSPFGIGDLLDNVHSVEGGDIPKDSGILRDDDLLSRMALLPLPRLLLLFLSPDHTVTTELSPATTASTIVIMPPLVVKTLSRVQAFCDDVDVALVLKNSELVGVSSANLVGMCVPLR